MTTNLSEYEEDSAKCKVKLVKRDEELVDCNEDLAECDGDSKKPVNDLVNRGVHLVESDEYLKNRDSKSVDRDEESSRQEIVRNSVILRSRIAEFWIPEHQYHIRTVKEITPEVASIPEIVFPVKENSASDVEVQLLAEIEPRFRHFLLGDEHEARVTEARVTRGREDRGHHKNTSVTSVGGSSAGGSSAGEQDVLSDDVFNAVDDVTEERGDETASAMSVSKQKYDHHKVSAWIYRLPGRRKAAGSDDDVDITFNQKSLMRDTK